VVASDPPRVIGMSDVPPDLGSAFAAQQPVPKVAWAAQRCVVLGDHWIMDGYEAEFETGAQQTLQCLKTKAPGMIGWML